MQNGVFLEYGTVYPKEVKEEELGQDFGGCGGFKREDTKNRVEVCSPTVFLRQSSAPGSWLSQRGLAQGKL